MLTTHARLKLVDQVTVLLVSGYMNIKVINENKRLIPADIINIVILFIHQTEGFFKAPSAIKISSKHDINCNEIATMAQDTVLWASIHGELDVDCNKFPSLTYQWTLNIQAASVSIDIHSDTTREYTDKYCFSYGMTRENTNRRFYAVGDTGMLEYENENGQWDHQNQMRYTERITEGDEIKMILNVKQKSLKSAFISIVYLYFDRSL